MIAEIICIAGIAGLLALFLYLAYWWGCNIRRTRDRHETMRGCKHDDISYLKELKHWVCNKCGCIFRYLEDYE